jgi:hypothetical protein
VEKHLGAALRALSLAVCPDARPAEKREAQDVAQRSFARAREQRVG